jgi:hypothetical protein
VLGGVELPDSVLLYIERAPQVNKRFIKQIRARYDIMGNAQMEALLYLVISDGNEEENLLYIDRGTINFLQKYFFSKSKVRIILLSFVLYSLSLCLSLSV